MAGQERRMPRRKGLVKDMGDKRKVHGERRKESMERNLPGFFEAAASVDNVYAGVSFLLRFYGFYESLADGGRVLAEEPHEIWQTVCRTVKENFLEGFDGRRREEAVCTLMGLRRTVTDKMQVLTAYTDSFSLYEYMLNRVEPRFEENLCCPEDDAAAREILQYIFAEKDNLLVNIRIQQMLSQLPVRMSRGKFEELVRAGFEHYAGMDVSSVEEFVDRIESSAGLYEPAGMRQYFPELGEGLAAMREKDWKNMGEDDCKSTGEQFRELTKKLEEITDQYYSLMELVNPLCAWLLNYPYASAESAARMEVFFPLFRLICERALAGEYSVLSGQEAELVAGTEGILEEFGPKLTKLQSVLSGFDEETEKTVEALMLAKQYSCIKSSALLLGNSLFADLDRCREEKQADRDYLKKAADNLVEKLLAAFSGQQAVHNRAMTAAVLSQLPVFFNSHNEVMDYVRGSLAGCHEVAEKAAGIRMMRELMRA